MKKNYFLKYGLIFSLFLILITTSNGAVHIIKKGDNIHVSTTREAVSGYKGCEEKNLQKVTAYIYTLYQRQETDTGKGTKGTKGSNNGTCTQSPWKKIANRPSNNPEEIFKNLPDGEYKAIVYIASPLGCDIKNGSQKSIIYLKDKSGIVIFKSGEKMALKESSVLQSKSKSKINNDDLQVFPIPTQDKLTVRLMNSNLVASVNMVFYDLQGKVVLENAYEVGTGKRLEWRVDVGSFSSGTYLLRVSDDYGNSYTKKIVVITK